jgi:hypothetical protein
MEDGWFGSPVQVSEAVPRRVFGCSYQIPTQHLEYIYSDIYVAQLMKNFGIIRCQQDQQAYYARLRYVSRWHLMITVTALGQSVSLRTI